MGLCLPRPLGSVAVAGGARPAVRVRALVLHRDLGGAHGRGGGGGNIDPQKARRKKNTKKNRKFLPKLKSKQKIAKKTRFCIPPAPPRETVTLRRLSLDTSANTVDSDSFLPFA